MLVQVTGITYVISIITSTLDPEWLAKPDHAAEGVPSAHEVMRTRTPNPTRTESLYIYIETSQVLSKSEGVKP